MKNDYKPDFGIWLKENSLQNVPQYFYSVEIKDVMRIGKTGYPLLDN